jgi:two-component system, LytTR family, response regulator
MQPISTIVCDDEPDAREGLLALLARDPQVVVVGQAATGLETARLIEEQRPELVFLDIQMPEVDGFGALGRLEGGCEPVVVFVTAHDEHALRAFDVRALDYLLKPFSDERFGQALSSAKTRVRQRRAGEIVDQFAALVDASLDEQSPEHGAPTPALHEGDPTTAPSAYASPHAAPRADRIMVRTTKQVVFVRVDDVDWIEADDYYAKLHVGGHAYLIRETMQSLETRLDPKRFARVHRSAIVNLDRIKAMQPYFRGAHVLTLSDGTRLTLSRSRRASFERALGCRL